MTVSTVVAGLLPIFWSNRVGPKSYGPLATPFSRNAQFACACADRHTHHSCGGERELRRASNSLFKPFRRKRFLILELTPMGDRPMKSCRLFRMMLFLILGFAGCGAKKVDTGNLKEVRTHVVGDVAIVP